LNLYVRDTRNESFANFGDPGKSFEPWESPNLAVVRSYSPANALACFAGLLTSEIGHRFDLFDSLGWDMLRRILMEGKLIAYLHVCFEVLQTFFASSDRILASPQCEKTFLQFWSGDVEIQKNDILLFMKTSIADSVVSLAEIHFVVKFWCTLIFSSPNWSTSPMHLYLLDEFCRFTYQSQHSFELLSVFSVQYRSMIFSCEPNESEQKWKILSPVTKIFNTAKERLLEKTASSTAFPTFIRSSNYIGKPTLYAEKHYFFLLVAISVEVFAERDIRQEVGSKLVCNHKITDSVFKKVTEKPIDQFCIYKLLDILLHHPLDHPTMPILCQV
jgi:hypothetical protein